MICCDDYIQGQRPNFSIEIRDEHVLTDPATLTFAFETPAGVVTTYVYGVDAALVRDSVGKFHVEITLTEPGWWKWRQESTGVVTADQGKFKVTPELI